MNTIKETTAAGIDVIYDRKLQIVTALIQPHDPTDLRTTQIFKVSWVWHKYAPLDNSYKAYERMCICQGQDVDKLWKFLCTNFQLREPVNLYPVADSYEHAYKHCNFLKYRQYKPGRREK